MKLALILLAAGDSRRFGGNKLLTPYKGKPMYRYLADEIAKLPPGLLYKKVVVTQYQEIEKTLKAEGYQTVQNNQSQLGISHSIHLGIKALTEEEPLSYCFSVCDQPHLKADTIKNLIKSWRQSGKGLACLSAQGEPGNPVIFSYKYKPELLALTGDKGGKRILKKYTNDIHFHEVPHEQELQDIDTRP